MLITDLSKLAVYMHKHGCLREQFIRLSLQEIVDRGCLRVIADIAINLNRHITALMHLCIKLKDRSR